MAEHPYFLLRDRAPREGGLYNYTQGITRLLMPAAAQLEGAPPCSLVLPPAWGEPPGFFRAHADALGGLPMIMQKELPEDAVMLPQTLPNNLQWRTAQPPNSRLSLFQYTETLRQRTFASLGIKSGVRFDNQDQRAVILQRDTPARYITQINLIHEWLKAEGYDVWIGDHMKLPFKERLELFADTSLLIATQGCGLTNTVWMPPGAVVIELSIWGLCNPAYGNLVAVRGQHYYWIPASEPPDQTKMVPHKKPHSLPGFWCPLVFSELHLKMAVEQSCVVLGKRPFKTTLK